MDNNQCSMLGCSRPSTSLCKCQKPYVHLCEFDMIKHMESSFSPSETLSDEELSILKKAKKRLFQIQNDSISQIDKEYLAKPEGLREEHAGKLERINEKISLVLNRLDYAISANLTLKSSNDKFILKIRQSISLQGEDLERSLEKVLFKYIGPCTSKEYSKERFNYWFKYGTKTLFEVDSLELVQRDIEIDTLPERLGRWAGICALEDGDIFYCGGSSGISFIASCYKINPKTREFQKLPDFPSNLGIVVPLQQDDYVYVFGNGAVTSNLAFKYSLKEARWESLPKMPFISQNTFCISVYQSIFLIGFYSKGVYQFNKTDYTKVFNCGTGYKALFKTEDGEIFLMSRGTIFSSSENDYSNWRSVG